jgi:hypothetical protein
MSALLPLMAFNVGLSALATDAQLKAQGLDTSLKRATLDYNAQIDTENAATAIANSQVAASDIRRETDTLISSHRATMAANGVVTTEGSPLLDQLKQREFGATSEQRALLQGQQKAAAFSAEAELANYESAAEQARKEANKTSTILSGIAGGAAGSYNIFKNT